MLYLFIILIVIAGSSAIKPGPVVTATKGEVWPKPQHEEKSQDYFVIKPHSFAFKAPDNIGCPNFLNEALTRYWDIIALGLREPNPNQFFEFDESFIGYLENLNIQLDGDCANEDVRPEFGDVENYTLTINADENVLAAPSIWGILRGLETFSQLVYFEQDFLLINATTITDFPRFPHRGFLLDTSRHYEPVEVILKSLDAMAYNKFNVFHWHIVDDHSFPYQSIAFPELSEKGAYHPEARIYTQIDVRDVIEYARLRGIRVIPEFDTPGHTRSWGESHPELLTSCYSGDLGPMDPSKQSTFDFITDLFTEVVQVFPDSYFHIGGDEVDADCWKNNSDISKFMTDNNLTTYSQLENYFIQKVVNLLDGLNSKYLVWEEVFVNGVTLPNTTVVHVWRNNGFSTLHAVTGAGKFGLFSSCWYLSDLAGGGDWTKFYQCDPHDFPGTPEQKRLVLGGEACMWGEYVNEYSVIPRVWPRASAVAEKLWSDTSVNDVDEAKPRIEEHTCRMNSRGIEAQPPNGPGFCR